MGKLFVISTPIGNLKDITLRALEVLRDVDYITCEDTRVSSKLLARYEIRKPLISFHAHSNKVKIDKIIDILGGEKSVALVTDAGTPGISDPGGVLVESAYKDNIEVEIVPGPSSVTAALALSGFPVDQFSFLGYFPRKKGRETLIKKLMIEKRAVIFFESPHRIEKTIESLLKAMPEREIFIARELTKKFEETYRGKLSEIKDIKPKGEFAIVLRGAR